MKIGEIHITSDGGIYVDYIDDFARMIHEQGKQGEAIDVSDEIQKFIEDLILEDWVWII